MTILHNKEDAEDTLQETFIEFFNKIDSFDNSVDLKVALLSIAKYRALDLYRKNQKNLTSLSEDMDIYGKNEQSNISIIITLNNLLGEIQADVVIKKIVYNMTFNEIAKSIDKSLGETQSIYYKSLSALKECYKEN